MSDLVIVSRDLATVASYDLTATRSAPLHHSYGSRELASLVSMAHRALDSFGTKQLLGSTILENGALSPNGEAMLRIVGGLLSFMRDVNALPLNSKYDPYWGEALLSFAHPGGKRAFDHGAYLNREQLQFWQTHAIERRHLFMAVEMDELREGSVKVRGLRFRVAVLEISAVIGGVAALPDAVAAVQKYALPAIEQTYEIGQAFAQYAVDQYLSGLEIKIDHKELPAKAEFVNAVLPMARRALPPRGEGTR